MGKGKKRRRIDQVSHMSNLTGFGGTAESPSTSLDDCMAEFQQQQQQQSTGDDSNGRDLIRSPDKDTSHISEKNHQPSWTHQSSCMSPDEIDIWNQSFLSWATRRSHGNAAGIGSSQPYPPGLLPNIDEELARNFKVKELSSLLLKRFPGSDLRMPVFERWLLDSKLEEQELQSEKSRSTNASISRDPVLPLHASPESEASQRLLEELLATSSTHNNTTAHIERKDAEEMVAELCRKTNLFCQELLSQRERYRRQSPLNKGDRIQIEQDSAAKSDVANGNNDVVTILYSRKKWKKPFCFKLNRKHYDALKRRFVQVHDSPKRGVTESFTSTPWPPLSLCDLSNADNIIVDRAFHVIVLALLLRYSALSGGQLLDDLRGGGMQGAIHAEVFDVLKRFFGDVNDASSKSWLEGFASPFNTTLPRFASAFPDLDWHFGAVGSFFDCSFATSGCDDIQECAEYCEVNPPFSVGVMQAMANHMSNALSSAEEGDQRLSFVVIVPSGVDPTEKSLKRSKVTSSPLTSLAPSEAVVKKKAQHSFEQMISSRYCTKHVRLKAREHGYVEGSQHLRPTRYKTSSYDTSVIILQSPKAKSKSLCMDQLESDVRRAFSSRHEFEISQRKTNSLNGDNLL
jgi:Phosphorylated CTD interacting factor 1 WW domain